MLAGLGAWVVWGGRPEPQPVSPLEPASRARKRQVIAVHLSASPVHRSQPGRLDSELRRGEWHCHVPEPSSARVRDAAIEGLRNVIEQDLATRGNPPAEVPVTLRVDEGVGDDVVSAVQGMLGDLGIADVTTR
ncbi:MAG: hypothetical protein R3F05_03785 [Planctomycetota bacterium]